MRKLSQKAWNNVLIFSMLILIAVLNYDSLFGSDDAISIELVPQGNFILSLQINELSFERIGNGWRVSAPSNDDLPDMQNDGIQALIAQWQSARLRKSAESIPSERAASPDYIVSLWLAGDSEPTLLGLLNYQGTDFAVYRGELYLLDFPTIQQLVPANTQAPSNEAVDA
ncbi:hypothetical protein PN836_013570 [Ningiella sp. W23]|uniref:hypothetical protein n=1 Tax=Ningiella sp. W23 TaxID=3023715 RepID=UPI003757EF39